MPDFLLEMPLKDAFFPLPMPVISLFTLFGLRLHQWVLAMKGNLCQRGAPSCQASRMKYTALSPALQPGWISLVHSTKHLPRFLTPTTDAPMPGAQHPGSGGRLGGIQQQTKLLGTTGDGLHASSSLIPCSLLHHLT